MTSSPSRAAARPTRIATTATPARPNHAPPRPAIRAYDRVAECCALDGDCVDRDPCTRDHCDTNKHTCARTTRSPSAAPRTPTATTAARARPTGATPASPSAVIRRCRAVPTPTRALLTPRGRPGAVPAERRRSRSQCRPATGQPVPTATSTTPPPHVGLVDGGTQPSPSSRLSSSNGESSCAYSAGKRPSEGAASVVVLFGLCLLAARRRATRSRGLTPPA